MTYEYKATVRYQGKDYTDSGAVNIKAKDTTDGQLRAATAVMKKLQGLYPATMCIEGVQILIDLKKIDNYSITNLK